MPTGPTSSQCIFLIGYRGSGKTSVARVLAERLGWDWVDADQAIEKREGRSIRAIFASDGEESFRDLESMLLVELFLQKPLVVATGGGVVLRENNRRILRESERVIWLT